VIERRKSRQLSEEFFEDSEEMAIRAYGDAAEHIFSTMHSLLADELVVRWKGKPQPRTILDVGTGLLNLALKLNARFPESKILALDIAINVLSHAKKEKHLPPACKPIAGDVETLPFPADSIDLITGYGSVHHWGDTAAGFSEIRRVLSPEGLAYINDLRGDTKKETVHTIAENLPSAIGGAFLESIAEALTPAELEGVLKKASISDYTVTTRPYSRRVVAISAPALRAVSFRINPEDILWGILITKG
jgi:ubiquinone/menaquinone biosynthesis C-methylase UbiE